jgi:pimeloyl-ACP methyl ester carboxylesterase
MRVDNYAFLHGGGQGSWVWDRTIEVLNAQGGIARSIALDVPGCGVKRERTTDLIAVDDIAAELVADIEAAGLRDVVLVGHSQAGSILPKMAAMKPDLFHRLIYISCSSPLPGQTVRGMIGDGLHGDDPDEVGWPVDPRSCTTEERHSIMFCNDMNPAEAATFTAQLGKDSWPIQSYAHSDWRYEHLDAVPASYVVCLRDGILPVVWQERFAERFRCERIVSLDAGHQAMITRPHGLAEILRHEVLVADEDVAVRSRALQ